MDVKTVFSFNDITPDEHFGKKEILDLISNLLADKDIKETKLIYNLAKEIFDTLG